MSAWSSTTVRTVFMPFGDHMIRVDCIEAYTVTQPTKVFKEDFPPAPKITVRTTGGAEYHASMSRERFETRLRSAFDGDGS